MKRFNYDILSRTLTLWLNWIKVRLFENETGYDIQITLIIQPCYNLLTICFFFGFTLPCFLLFEISWTVQVQWIIKTAERRIKREKEKNKKKKTRRERKTESRLRKMLDAGGVCNGADRSQGDWRQGETYPTFTVETRSTCSEQAQLGLWHQHRQIPSQGKWLPRAKMPSVN